MRPPRFQRAAGLTPSERLLAEIADRSFLKLWTYPNPYKELNRELADLIVVFGDDVLLFSDKGGAYPESGDQTLDWTRYYRSAITQSAAQLRTAEHWIRRSPDRVYLDVRCTERLSGLPGRHHQGPAGRPESRYGEPTGARDAADVDRQGPDLGARR